jgi:Tol biopolymer transport system component
MMAWGLLLSSCNTRRTGDLPVDIAYPQPAPDSAVLSFLPGTVSSDSLDFNAAFSPDGRSFYFSRSQNKKLAIYVTTYDGKHWTAPVHASFSGTAYSDADPAFSPDGKIYFISNRPRTPSDTLDDYDIWYASPAGENQWSAPENLISINSDSSEFYISFSTAGTMYFSSSRAGGRGSEDLYRSALTNGHYDVAENLGAEINSAESEYDPGIAPDESVLVFASSGRKESLGRADLYYATRSPEGQWTRARHLDPFFNTNGREYCPYFSPDFHYFFFSSGGDVKWVDRKMLLRHVEPGE